MIDIRLLGPFEVIEDGRPVALPGRKPRALLVQLLLDGPRVVGAETLIDGLWGQSPPASARKVLQVYVSQLRTALGAERIETRPPGYVLRVGRDESDLGRFEVLAEAAADSADATRRSRLLGEALSLWRGPALAELRDEPFTRSAARRLDELRLAVLERRVEADLELGRHERLVDELEPLVAQEPLREQLRRQLMLALYRCGRQADALARYREGRQLLVEELGIEPGPPLQELERAILRHDPALDQPELPRLHARGCVIDCGAGLEELLAPLCVDGRELLLVELPQEAAELAERSGRLEHVRAALIGRGLAARTASFTSQAPGTDLARLAAEQGAQLVVARFDELSRAEREALLTAAPCDVALAGSSGRPFAADAPVLVPFGGGREEWAALELGAWLARAHDLPLRLLGTEAGEGRRDASRMLAGASLALQRFAGTSAEPAIVPPGPAGILAERGAVVVAALPTSEPDTTRRTLLERSAVPVLLVRPGLRPGGLAPDRTLTRFSWSLHDDEGELAGLD